MCRIALDTLTLRSEQAPKDIPSGMHVLVDELKMLTGLSVACGNVRQSAGFHTGLSREILRTNEGFVDAPLAITSCSIFDLASLTKLFCAIAVLQLVEAGKLSFADFLGERDTRFINLRQTTLYDVLTYQAVLRSPERIDSQPDAQSARALVFQVFHDRSPEPARLYSDMNALLLKYLVETLSGYAFYDYLKRYILIPCGMAETYARVPQERLQDCLNYNYEHQIIAGRALLLDKVTPGLPHDPKARLLAEGGKDLAGHAGLFSTLQDMVRLAQGLLRGDLLSSDMLLEMGRNRTGRHGKGVRYRQYLGYLCFSKSEDQDLSEIPVFMGEGAIGLSGYTGNHFALDPELGVFDVFLGNRCHNRVAVIEPAQDAARYHLSPEGAGRISWPDGRLVQSSWRYVHQKDRLLHTPCYHYLKQAGWLAQTTL